MLSNKPHPRTVENMKPYLGQDTLTMWQEREQPGNSRRAESAGVEKLILDRFGVKPEECLYFGDTNTDMKTGLGAGLQTVGVTWGFRRRQTGKLPSPAYYRSHPDEVIRTDS